MKITESQLRSIIKQELNKSLKEAMYSTSPNAKMKKLGINSFDELIGRMVVYELGEQGHFARGKIASVDSNEYQFTLDPKSVEFDFRPISRTNGPDWRKQDNLRPNELTFSINDIKKVTG